MDVGFIIDSVAIFGGLVAMTLLLTDGKVPRLRRKPSPKELPDPLKAALENKRRVHRELADEWTDEFQRLLHAAVENPWRECGCADCSRWKLYELEEKIARENRMAELARQEERRQQALEDIRKHGSIRVRSDPWDDVRGWERAAPPRTEIYRGRDYLVTTNEHGSETWEDVGYDEYTVMSAGGPLATYRVPRYF